ncbi:MAG: metallophosphoesterase [Porcipelethomonas sp.]
MSNFDRKNFQETSMIVTSFAFFYIVLNIFISIDLYLWIKSFRNPFRWRKARFIFVAGYSILTSLIFIAYFLPPSGVKQLFSRISNYYLGFLINLSMVILISHIIALILKLCRLITKDFFKSGKTKFMAGWICAVVSISFSVYGFVNANRIYTTLYDVSVAKTGEDMKIVLIADTHLGYSLGVRNMKKMVRKINELEPDLVCFAGDIFDNEFDALDDPEGIRQAFLSIESTYGIYACWGNHDIKEKLFGGFTVSSDSEPEHDQRMREFLEESGINLLEDETTVIDDRFTIIGRLDLSKPGTEDNQRKDISEFEFDKSKLVIDIDHEPKELQETADAGVDLDLCGHTHNGQFFPLTLGMSFIWENPAGYIQKTGKDGNIMHNIVTEGVGVYGPFMRTFTHSEIVEINVHFTG